MRTPAQIQTILRAHRHTLRKTYGVRRIGIFGSRARGDNTPLSDVDILVELEAPVGGEIVDLHSFLEDVLAIRVDLVTQGAVARKPLL